MFVTVTTVTTNDKWSKNFDNRPHCRAVDFHRGWGGELMWQRPVGGSAVGCISCTYANIDFLLHSLQQ